MHFILGKDFHFPGCHWTKKKVEWTADDSHWITATNLKFDELFGGDFLDYSQTTSKTCVVDEYSIPQKYQYLFVNDTPLTSKPTQTDVTPQPNQFKQPKAGIVKRGLNFGKPTNTSSQSLPYPRTTVIRLPKVCPWGGLYKSNCGNITIKLINTCPIDNFLTIFSVNIKRNSYLLHQIRQIKKPFASKLLEVAELYNNRRFADAKIKWLQQLPQVDVTTSGTINVWGNEEEYFVRYLSEAFATTITSTCVSPHCPKSSCTSTVPMIYLKEASVLQPNENLLEAALREWISPSPTQCGQRFQNGSPPPGADWVFGPPGLCATTNQSFKIQMCNGVRTYHRRSFVSGIPFALPFSLQRFSAQVTVVSQLPMNITVEATTYELVGCTMFGNGHYTAFVKFGETGWAHYDGLRESKSQGSGLFVGTEQLSKPSSVYKLSTCVYIIKQ